MSNSKKHTKMKLHIKLIIIVFSLSLMGCEDYLNRYPLNNPSDVTFLSNETELKMAVAGCYSQLWYQVEEMPFFMCFDQMTDLGFDRNGSSLQAIGRGAQDSQNGTVVSFWTNMYAGIAKCNYVLANMERGKSVIPDAFYKQSESEVRFLRALYYSYLVELYGGVPLVTIPLTLSEAQMSRNTKEEVVSFILTELDQCAEYSPNSSYMDLFQYAGQSSKEIIFSIQYLKGTATHTLFRSFGSRNAKAYTNKKPAYQLADSWECTDGKQIDESPLFDPQHPYVNRDPRLGFTLAVSGSTFLGFQFETHGDSVMCWNYNLNPAKRVGNLEATHAYATFTGICWRKYADNLDRLAIKESELNTIVIRYAEVLLNYAEAKIESGTIDQSVLDAINKVRQRPSVNMPPITTTDQNELRNAVRRERKYELSGEGFRLFDIRRWEIAEDVMNLPVLGRMKKSYPSIAPVVDEVGTASYTNIPIAQQGESSDFKMRVVEIRTFDKNRDYLWPIPYIEMDTNPEMVQNPGYGE